MKKINHLIKELKRLKKGALECHLSPLKMIAPPETMTLISETIDFLEQSKKVENDWKSNAHRFGETMSTVGPNGYYDFAPDEWYEWMVKTRRREWTSK